MPPKKTFYMVLPIMKLDNGNAKACYGNSRFVPELVFEKEMQVRKLGEPTLDMSGVSYAFALAYWREIDSFIDDDVQAFNSKK